MRDGILQHTPLQHEALDTEVRRQSNHDSLAIASIANNAGCSVESCTEKPRNGNLFSFRGLTQVEAAGVKSDANVFL